MFLTVTIGKGIGRVYNYSQRNWPNPSPNTTFFVPPISDNPTLQGTTGRKSTSPDNQISTEPLECLCITSKLDSDVKNDDGSQYFPLL